EGEKDCENLRKLGIVATTNAGGAGQWHDEHTQALRGADVVIVPDNDDAGHLRTRVVGTALRDVANRVRVLELPGLAHKEDVSDWIAAGGTREQLDALVERAPDWQPRQDITTNGTSEPASARGSAQRRVAVLVRADELEPESVHWAWKNPFAFAKLAMIPGAPGLGKSTVLIEIVALHSKGGDFPCGEGRAQKCECLILTAEDGLRDTVVPRLSAAGADMTKVHFLTGTKIEGAGDGEASSIS